jgi:L-lactate dehydrogenase complex protein LldE
MLKVQLFIPCFIHQLYLETRMNMVRVLRLLGCEVHYNTKQTCCGQPAYNGLPLLGHQYPNTYTFIYI